MMHPMGGGCGQMGGVLMAATAALGWWVLRQGEKDGGLVRWAGRVVGWVLVVVGLGGFLCSAANHAKRLSSCGGESASKCRHHTGMGGGMPYGHPPVDGSAEGESHAPAHGHKAK